MSYLFHGQRSNEEVILFTKQHPLVLLRPFLVSAALWLLPFVVYIFSSSNSVLSLAVIGAFVAGLIHGFFSWYAWNNSVLLVTNERVVLLQQKSILHREFVECGLHTIQQVSHGIKGLLNTIFGFGSILIYTGGAQAPITIPNMPDPYELQQEILRAGAGEGLIEVDPEEDDD